MVDTTCHFQNELLDNAPVWILASDRDSGVLRVANKIARKELKLTQDDFHKLSERDYWAVESERVHLIKRQQEYGHAIAEVELLKLTGERVWATVSCQGDPENSTNILWWITDNTEQKKAQQELQQREHMLREVLDALPVAVFAKDVKNDLRYVLNNRKFKEMWGLPNSGVINRNDAEENPTELANVMLQQDLEIFRTGHPFIQPENVLELPDGDYCYISTRKVLLKDQDGQPSLVVGMTEDITERMEAERSMKVSEKRFRELVVGSPVGIFFTDANGALMYANEQWQKTAGMTNSQAAGQGWTKALHPDDADRVLRVWHDFLEKNSYGSDFQEFRFVGPNGHVTWVSSKVVAFKNDGDQVVGFIGSNTDITRLKQYETELKLSRDEANRANAAKSEFLSRMSHELRTPLNAVLGFGQLLQMDGESLTEKQAEKVAHIIAAGDQLLHMIEDVLDFSRAESGNLSMNIQKFPLSRVFQESVSLVAEMAIHFQVELITRLHSDFRVLADERRLQQILVKLLNNAIKYNHRDGKVEIAASSRPGGIVRISVNDTGRGIRPADEERLFKSFEKITYTGDHEEGAGIGLSICKKLAELMGSNLGYSSKVGVGSEFWIDLPVATLDAVSAQAPEWMIDAALEPDLRGLRLLYIEENAAVINPMLKVAQHIEDCEFVFTSNPFEGVALGKAMRPDIILMGMSLPGLDGFSVLEILGKDSRTSEIPVIAIAAVASPEVVQKGLAAGFARFMTKPLNLDHFFQAIVDVRTRQLQSKSEGKSAALSRQ